MTLNITILAYMEIEEVFQFLEKLIGVPYVFWTADQDNCGCMSYASNDKVPSINYIKQHGINCVGVINLARRFVGKPIPGLPVEKYAGGTYVWFKYLETINLLEEFDFKKSYPKGTLLIRNYQNELDQGHVAIIYKEDKKGVLFSKLLHAYSYSIKNKNKKYQPGLTIDNTVGLSHILWGINGYYTHICLPENWLFK